MAFSQVSQVVDSLQVAIILVVEEVHPVVAVRQVIQVVDILQIIQVSQVVNSLQIAVRQVKHRLPAIFLASRILLHSNLLQQ